MPNDDRTRCTGRGCPLAATCERYDGNLLRRGRYAKHASMIANCVPYDAPLTGTDADYPLFTPREPGVHRKGTEDDR